MARRDYSALTVKQLKDLAACKKLPQKGTKGDIIARLELHNLSKDELVKMAKKAGLPTTGTKAMLVRRIESGKPIKNDIILKRPRSSPTKKRHESRCKAARKTPTKRKASPKKRKTPTKRKPSPKKKTSPKRKYARRRRLEEEVEMPPKRKYARRRAKELPKVKTLEESLRDIEATLEEERMRELGLIAPEGRAPEEIAADIEAAARRDIDLSATEEILGLEPSREIILRSIVADDAPPKIVDALDKSPKETLEESISKSMDNSNPDLTYSVLSVYLPTGKDIFLPSKILEERTTFRSGDEISNLYQKHNILPRKTGEYIIIVDHGYADSFMEFARGMRIPMINKTVLEENYRELFDRHATVVPTNKIVEIDQPRFEIGGRNTWTLEKAKFDSDSGLLIPTQLVAKNVVVDHDADISTLYDKFDVIPEYTQEYLVLVEPDYRDNIVKAVANIDTVGVDRTKAVNELDKLLNDHTRPVPYTPKPKESGVLGTMGRFLGGGVY